MLSSKFFGFPHARSYIFTVSCKALTQTEKNEKIKMSVKAKLLIDDKEINVLSFSFGFNQEADYNGRPSQNQYLLGYNW